MGRTLKIEDIGRAQKKGWGQNLSLLYIQVPSYYIMMPLPFRQETTATATNTRQIMVATM